MKRICRIKDEGVYHEFSDKHTAQKWNERVEEIR
jgi:hypothetical protein